MEKRFTAGIITVLLILLFSSSVAADSEAAKITADQITYDYQHKRMEASGNVKIIYKDISVASEKAFIDQEQNIILATENVHIIKKDSRYTGNRFLYYMNTEEGLLAPVDSEIRDKQINGPIKFSSRESYFIGEVIKSRGASFTGCDRDHPHYHFVAKRVEYYPEDRVVMHNVWYWEHKVPLMYLPVFYISLKEERDNFEFSMGQNQIEGFFVKIGYNYIFSDNNYGKVSTRLTEKGGNELGVKHYSKFNERSKFYQDYSLVENSKLGNPHLDYKIGFGYENEVNSKFRFSTAFEDWKRSYIYLSGIRYEKPHQERAFNFLATGQSPYPGLSVRYSENTGTGYYLYDFSSNWSLSPDPSLGFSFNGRYVLENLLNIPWNTPVDINNIPQQSANNFNYSGTLRKDWGWSNLSITHTDTQVYNGNISSNNLKPDAVYTIPKWHWPLLGDVKVSGGYLYLEKSNNGVIIDHGERWALDIQKIPLSLWQTSQSSLNWESKFGYRDFFNTNTANYIYHQKETELYALTTNLNLSHQFTKVFSTNLKLGYTEAEGTPNYFFGRTDDNILDGAFISNEWRWQSSAFYTLVSTGYNITREIASPLTVSSRWTPAAGSEVNFNTTYDWLKGLGLTTIQANYNPNQNWRLALSAGYDFQLDSWSQKQFEALIRQKVFSKLEAEVIAKFDMFRNAFVEAKTGLVYDWHCRKFKLNYDWLRSQYTLTLIFNAIPGSPLEFSSEHGFEGMFNAIQF